MVVAGAGELYYCLCVCVFASFAGSGFNRRRHPLWFLCDVCRAEAGMEGETEPGCECPVGIELLSFAGRCPKERARGIANAARIAFPKHENPARSSAN